MDCTSPSKSTNMHFRFKQPNRTKSKLEDDLKETYENYFEHAESKTVTSSSKLKDMNIPMLGKQASVEALSRIANPHEDHIDNLAMECQDFNLWKLLLSSGLNLLFLGFGSKIRLLDAFMEELEGHNMIVVRGYVPALNYKSLAARVCEIMELELPLLMMQPKNVAQFLESVKEHLSGNETRVFLIIHNIDGPVIRQSIFQTLLSGLACIDKIHVIASADEGNVDLMWDLQTKGRFNWWMRDVASFLDYTVETAFEESLCSSSIGNVALSALTTLMRSLTPNAKKIFEVVALFYMNTPKVEGMPFQSCYIECRERFLVNSDLNLRTHLTEFIDHEVFKMKTNSAKVEIIAVNLSREVLKCFLDNKEN